MATIPQAILDMLTQVQGQKDVADADVASKAATAAAVVAAQQADASAASQLATDTASLQTSLTQLEALVDAYYRPGVQPPVPTPTTPPVV